MPYDVILTDEFLVIGGHAVDEDTSPFETRDIPLSELAEQVFLVIETKDEDPVVSIIFREIEGKENLSQVFENVLNLDPREVFTEENGFIEDKTTNSVLNSWIPNPRN